MESSRPVRRRVFARFLEICFLKMIVMALFMSNARFLAMCFLKMFFYDIFLVLTCEVVACRGGEVLVAVAAGDHLKVVHLYKTLSLSTLYRQLLLLTKKYKPSMMFTLFSKFF